MNNEWKDFLTEAGAEFAADNAHRLAHFGNPQRESQLVLNGSAIYDLSESALIRASGDDVVDFLQGQLSNDFAKVDAHSSQLSAYCSPKGRVLALFRICKRDDNYYLRINSELLDNTLNRLKMFVMRAKVELEVEEQLVLFGASGPEITQHLQNVFDKLPANENEAVMTNDVTIIRTNGIHPCFEILAPLEEAKSIWHKLNVHAAPVGFNANQLFKIQSGIPEFSPVTIETQVPQMVNLEQLDAINFDKGCYPGQEIVARTHYLGKQKKRMYVVDWNGVDRAEAGTSLYQGKDKNGEPVGTILYDAEHPDGRIVALAVMRIAAAEGSERIFVEHSPSTDVSIAAPPYGFTLTTED